MVVSGQAMKALLDVSLPHRISQWPAAMLRAGLLVRGSTIPGRSFSLHDREHLYELNDAILRHRPNWIAAAGQLVDQGEKIWIGKNVHIDSSANLIGPIAIGDDVEIGPDAVLVGPTTIGRGCKIGASIVLKRSVVLPNTTLAGAAFKAHALSQAIVLGEDRPTIQAITQHGGGEFQTLTIDRPIRLDTVHEAGAAAGVDRIQVHAVPAHCKRARWTSSARSSPWRSSCPFPVHRFGDQAQLSLARFFMATSARGVAGRISAAGSTRTMVNNADEFQRKLQEQNEVDGPQFKMRDDPRIFWVGKWLRKLNLDEWPQFWRTCWWGR